MYLAITLPHNHVVFQEAIAPQSFPHIARYKPPQSPIALTALDGHKGSKEMGLRRSPFHLNDRLAVELERTIQQLHSMLLKMLLFRMPREKP